MGTNRLQPLFDTLTEQSEGVALFEGSLVEAEPRDGRVAVDTWQYRYGKRMVDFLGAVFLLAVFALPGVVIAVVIASTSPGPIFYREKRLGRYGRTFRIWKFRSMSRDAEKHCLVEKVKQNGHPLEWRMQKQIVDPRITPIGRFLRGWSLDEVPQLLNVLRGEMSLVGPRPIVQAEAALYGDLFSYYLSALPGMSGLWQVSGRSGVDYERRAELDMHYVKFWSVALDLRVLLRTIPAVLGRVGAA